MIKSKDVMNLFKYLDDDIENPPDFNFSHNIYKIVIDHLLNSVTYYIPPQLVTVVNAWESMGFCFLKTDCNVVIYLNDVNVYWISSEGISVYINNTDGFILSSRILKAIHFTIRYLYSEKVLLKQKN